MMNSNDIYEDNDVDSPWFQNLSAQIEKSDSKENVSRTSLTMCSSPILQKTRFVKESSLEIMPDYLKSYYYPRSPSPMVIFGELNEVYHNKSPQHNTNSDVDHHSIQTSDNGTIPMMTYDHYSGMYSTGLISNVTSDAYRFQQDDMEGIDNKISSSEMEESNHQENNTLWLRHQERNNGCKSNMETDYMEQKVYAELTNVNQDMSKCSEVVNNNMSINSVIRDMDDASNLIELDHTNQSSSAYRSNILMKHFNSIMEKAKTQYTYDPHTINEGLSEMHNFFTHHKAIILMKSHEAMKNQISTKNENTIENNENNFSRSSAHVEEYCNDENFPDTYCKDISHDNIHLMDLENFALHFKNSRIRYGFTQGDVGHQLGHIFGGEVSQTTISRFEALNLSYKNMIKQKPFLEEWLRITQQLMIEGNTVDDIMKNKLHSKFSIGEKADDIKNLEVIPYFEENKNENSNIKNDFKTIQNPILKRRRKRTNLDVAQREYLNRTFNVEPNPDHSKMEEIALDLGLDKEIVRVWFCNKRQKMRKFSLVNGVVLSNRLF
ncbi:POU-specific domain and Homeobox domain and Homeodomain-like and Lambda repressor-like, DNA-binding domain and POU domain-containing protein [Strongyloides ratti]|uniref:POU domain protein n=1 Tax=Strongyloides ratti TaxID=34506 RepID=A0A090MYN7_STRRB|nr:POU-specific domain and Homeobox domain and Homeodomain-like and Lambda repressor-like, DNA-binding domain and POU domain-containing protein [Strongyloides ratti]CEF67504.1 POU-specific domain and Homeobox domain and Homeodomain-like and Lambda repressor-like, DNA-binding domain and POU domain-containing protein [Strongyloides ratti]